MKKKVMVLLVGGRLTPNFIGVLGYQPDFVECLVSEDEKAKYDDVLEVLSSLAKYELPSVPHFVVPAFDMQANVAACREIVDMYPDAEVIFNATCGTKVMAIAAYEVAKQTQHPAIYLDTAHNRFLDLTGLHEQPMPIRITLEDYLAFFGRSPHKTFEFNHLTISEEQAVEAARFLAEAGKDTATTLALMRPKSQGKGRRTVRLELLANEQWDMLSRLDQFGLIENLTRESANEFRYTIPDDQNWNFINGTWLEAYVFDCARQCKDAQGNWLFDGCEMSLEIPGPTGVRKEIDVSCMYKGQLLLCSCKSERSPFKTQYLDELRAVSSLLGGRFCSRLFITNIPSPPEGNTNEWRSYESFLQQAKDRQIVVVTGENLTQIANILKKEAEKPTFWRI